MKQKFNVLMWDFNSDKLVHYDVLPYLRNRYKDRVENFKKYSKEDNKYIFVPKTLDEFKKFVENESMYMFWSRCEYEMICHGWPAQKNDYKLDVYEQIMMNIDVIVNILFDELNKNNIK